MRRRDVLRLLGLTGLGVVAGAHNARAIGEASKFRFGRLDLTGDDRDREGALPRLAWELNLRTSVDASYEIGTPDPTGAALYDHPFLYLGGGRSFPPLADATLRQLRRHLEFGGFLLVDDTSGHGDSEFDRSFRREVARLFPDAPLERLDDGHSIYRSYYLLRRLGGRVLVSPFLEGCTLGERTPLIYCRNDLGGAWARNAYGRWLHECTPGGEAQRQQAFAFGVNAVLYALTVNYKQDQIHLPFILDRMRGR